MRRPLARSLLIQGGAISANRWTPASLGSALSLWLDAADASTITLNGATISQWNDKSGNGRHASQGTATLQPTYQSSAINDMPAASFAPEGGTNLDNLRASLSITQNAVTVFVIATKTANSGNTRHRYSRVITFWNTSDVPSNPGDFGGVNGWLAIGMFQQDTQAGVVPPSITTIRNNSTMTAQPLTYATPFIIGNTINASTIALRVNGNQSSGVTSSTPMNSTQVIIGGSPSGFDGELNGLVSEIIIASAALPSSDQEKIEGYLAWKWKLQTNLPFGHPFRNRPPSR